MILGFKPQLKQPILDGIKIHTIRMDKKKRWRKLMKIHYATGVRTKNYNEFKRGVCTGTQRIDIGWDGTIYIDKKLLSVSEAYQLARNDGFNGLQEMFDWFDNEHELPIEDATLIHWTDFRY